MAKQYTVDEDVTATWESSDKDDGALELQGFDSRNEEQYEDKRVTFEDGCYIVLY